MVEAIGVEIMKILATKSKKTLTLKEIDMVLSINELDDLMNFLAYTKKSFTERQEDCSVKKLTEKAGEFCIEDITSYKKIVESGNEIIENHYHYKDWCKADNQIDIVLHTTFKAEKKADDTFVWINME